MSEKKSIKKTVGYSPKKMPNAGHTPKSTKETRPPKGGTGQS